MATALTASQYDPLLRERADDQNTLDRLVELIRTTDAPILADEQMGLLVLNGKPILMQPFEMSQLAAAGLWNQQPFLDALARGDYPVVLLYQPDRNPRCASSAGRRRWSASSTTISAPIFKSPRRPFTAMRVRDLST